MFIHRSGAAGPGCSAVSVHAGRHGNTGRRAPGPPHPSRRSAGMCRLKENHSPAVSATSPYTIHDVIKNLNGNNVLAASPGTIHEGLNNSNGDTVSAGSPDPVLEAVNNSNGDTVPAVSPDPVLEAVNNSNGDTAESDHMFLSVGEDTNLEKHNPPKAGSVRSRRLRSGNTPGGRQTLRKH